MVNSFILCTFAPLNKYKMSFRAFHLITKNIITSSLLACCVFSPVWSQTGRLDQHLELQTSTSKGQTPLWLNANKYGLSSLNRYNAYARGCFSYSDAYQPWGIEYRATADIVLPLNYDYRGYKGSSYTNHVIVQQFYAEVKWHKGLLTIGPKQQPSLFRNNKLSSGAQTFGINARPVPQGRLEMLDWWDVPFTRQWVAYKGHISFGFMSDANWEEGFSGKSGRQYNRWTRFHEKSGYLRFGKEEKFPLTFIFGLEMGAQFGGTLYNYQGTDQNGYRSKDALKLMSNLKSYWNAFIPGGGDVNETEFQNAEGNQVGSWIFRFNWEKERYAIGLYLDHYFEDHSSMFQADYDGYGEGKEWREKQKLKFFGYDFLDGQLGFDLKLKQGTYLKDVVIEYMNTCYQSGPVYHDHNEGNNDHLGGIDDYYNHSTLPGWQHWGQALGNPLYRSPQYNTNGNIYFESNRFKAWHAGASGEVIKGLDYRLLYTWQKSWGCYRNPFIRPQENTSILIEFTYRPLHLIHHDVRLKAAYGADFGPLLGNNRGLQISLQYVR